MRLDLHNPDNGKRGRSRKYSDDEIAKWEKMKKTMTYAQIAAATGIRQSIIKEQLRHHGSEIQLKKRCKTKSYKWDFWNENLSDREVRI